MRTKKAVVHGRNSKKRNYVSGSLHSKRNGLQKKRLLRNVTQKRGGAKVAKAVGTGLKYASKTVTAPAGYLAGKVSKQFVKKIKERNPTCEVSGDRFKPTHCFIQELSKSLGEGIMGFLNNKNDDESKAKFVKMDGNAKSHYNREAVKLFNELKRVLFPFLINVMEMREEGKLLKDVDWDLGYNTLVMLIILFNIDQIQYKSIKNDNLAVSLVISLQNDFKPNKLEIKKQKKCESELKCVTLSPENISQILIFYFLEGISSEGPASSRFIRELKDLIERRKQGGGSEAPREPSGEPSGTPSEVESKVESTTSKANTIGRVSNMSSEVFSGSGSVNVGEGNPSYVDPTSSTAQTVTYPVSSVPGLTDPITPKETPVASISKSGASETPVASGVSETSVTTTPAVTTEEEGDKSEFLEKHLDRFYRIVFGENSVEKPKNFIVGIKQNGYKLNGVEDSINIFNVCKNIFKNFKKDNQTIVYDTNNQEQLKHSQHLLCVGEIPEYMTEFDVPTQFREKDSKIADLGWPEAKFEKLKLVVFMEPDVNMVTSIQNGGGETSAPGLAPGPVPTEEERQGLLEKAQQKAKPNKTKEPERHSLYYGPEPEGGGEVAEASQESEVFSNGDTESQPEAESEVQASTENLEAVPIPQKLVTSPAPAPATEPAPETEEQKEKVAAVLVEDSSTVSDSGLPTEPNELEPLPVSTRREIHKIFSIYLRTDENKLPLDKFCKNGEYFVKYRVPALKLNKFQKSGDTSGSRFDYSLEQSKRMSFSYPVRFGPDFPKYVSLMLNESSYYKALEKGAEHIANLVKKYRRYEQQQKECEPGYLSIEEKVFVVDPKKNPGVRGVGVDNPAYNGEKGVKSRAFTNPAYEPGTNLKGVDPELLRYIVSLLGDKTKKSNDEKAMAHMIYELISSLRLSKLESDGSTAETVALQKTENERLVEYIRDMRARLDELQKKRNELIEKLGEAMKSQPPGADVTTKLQRIGDELQSRQEDIEALSAQNMELGSKVDALGIKLSKFIDENRKLTERVLALETSLRTQADAFEEKRAELQQELEEITRQNADLNGKNQELTTDIERVTAKLNSKDAQVAAKTEECESLRRQLKAANSENIRIQLLLNKCIKEEQERKREAQGSGAGAKEEVINQPTYNVATLGGPESLNALQTEEPPKVYDTASQTGSKITRDVKQRICEHFKVFNKSGAPIDSFVIKKEGLFYFANKNDFDCDGSEVLGNKINKQDLMRYSEFLMIFDGISGDLDFGQMREVYGKDAKSKSANFETRYSGIDLPVKLRRITEENRFQIAPNERYFREINKLKLYDYYKSKYGLDAGGTIERKKRIQSIKERKGGSRTKKLNKTNSRNKSKKINF